MTTKRKADGTFAKGHPGGPGRPPRPIEREYLAALADAVTPADWRDIVARAVKDATAGDARAREWLAKYLLGEPAAAALTLTELATREALGIEAEHEIAVEAEDAIRPPVDPMTVWGEVESALRQAYLLAEAGARR